LCRRNIGYVGGDGSGSGLSVRGRGCGRVVGRSLGKGLRGLNSVSREGLVVFFFFAGGTYEAMEAVEDVEPVSSSAFPS
jgi:hypothetical protein